MRSPLTYSSLIILLVFVSSLTTRAKAQQTEGPEAPDIVLIVVDSLRADHLGCYGYVRDTSPELDAFAGDATRFAQAIASGSWTQPSMMSLFTSVSPDIHLRCQPKKPHSTNVVTMAQALHDAGYQTVGLTSNSMTHRRYGFARGFDHYDDYTALSSPDTSLPTGQTAKGSYMTRLAEDWLLRHRDPEKPLFLFVLYMDSHWDYAPPAPFNKMFTDDPVPPPRKIWTLGNESVPEVVRQRVIAAYDGEIRYADSCVAALLKSIKESTRGSNTVIAYCADHGESFWERGLVSHGNHLYDEELHVPLIIRPPDRLADTYKNGHVVSSQVGLIDVPPTFLDFAGARPPDGWQGKSLIPLMKGESHPAERPIVLDVRIRKEGLVRGVRTSKYKVIGVDPYSTLR